MKRRSFLLSSTSALAASTILPNFVGGQEARSANSKVNVAFIGSGGWIAQQRPQYRIFDSRYFVIGN